MAMLSLAIPLFSSLPLAYLEQRGNWADRNGIDYRRAQPADKSGSARGERTGCSRDGSFNRKTRLSPVGALQAFLQVDTKI